MDYAFQAFLAVVVLLIVWGVGSHKLRQRRIEKATASLLPEVNDHFQVNRCYNIFLSHGKTLNGARFLGVSRSFDQGNPYLPFPLSRWLVVEKADGGRAYLKPESIRYYEDAEDDEGSADPLQKK